jgi:hypothetical protein
VRASRVPEVAADLRAHLGKRAVATRSNRSPSRPLALATFRGLTHSAYTRLAQLFDGAIRSNLNSRDVYERIVEEGLNAFAPRKSSTPTVDDQQPKFQRAAALDRRPGPPLSHRRSPINRHR